VLQSRMDENDEEPIISIDDEEEYQRIGQMLLEKLSTYVDGEEESVPLCSSSFFCYNKWGRK